MHQEGFILNALLRLLKGKPHMHENMLNMSHAVCLGKVSSIFQDFLGVQEGAQDGECPERENLKS